jgi:hypothetical protein
MRNVLFLALAITALWIPLPAFELLRLLGFWV